MLFKSPQNTLLLDSARKHVLNASVGHEKAKTRTDIWVHMSSSITLNRVEHLSFLGSLSNWSQCPHWDPLNQRSLSFRIYCLITWGRADLTVTEIKCTINTMYLNHSKSIFPPLVHGKTVFHETGPWSKKVGDADLNSPCFQGKSCLSRTLEE